MAYDGTAKCLANKGDEHCCWIDGIVCPYLEENTVEGRRWSCGLYVREELETDTRREVWDKVTATSEWQTNLKTCYDRLGVASCGDWPKIGKKCLACGAVGSRVD